MALALWEVTAGTCCYDHSGIFALCSRQGEEILQLQAQQHSEA